MPITLSRDLRITLDTRHGRWQGILDARGGGYISYEEEDACHMRRRMHVKESWTHAKGMSKETWYRGKKDLL
jgi:hypothetical protein